MQVNGVDVTSVQHDDAVKLLTYDIGHIVLDVRRSCPVSPGVTSETSDTSELEIVDLTLPYLKSLCPTGAAEAVPLPFRMESFKTSPDQSVLVAAAGANHVSSGAVGVTTLNRFATEIDPSSTYAREPPPTRFANSTRFATKIGSGVDARELGSANRFPPKASLSTDLDMTDLASKGVASVNPIPGGKVSAIEPASVGAMASNRFPLRVGTSADTGEPISMGAAASNRIPTPGTRSVNTREPLLSGMKELSLEARQAAEVSSGYHRSILRRLHPTEDDILPPPLDKDLCRNFFPPLSPSQRTELDDFDLACFLAPEDVDTGLDVRLKAMHQLIQNDIVRTIKPL